MYHSDILQLGPIRIKIRFQPGDILRPGPPSNALRGFARVLESPLAAYDIVRVGVRVRGRQVRVRVGVRVRVRYFVVTRRHKVLCVRQLCRRRRLRSGIWAVTGREGVQHAYRSGLGLRLGLGFGIWDSGSLA